ncbi:hypothetical protein F4774DRAFT_97676 [Daldinia eschscholtzii]|nr:hypothetical protein F4774DRAFT_97676 [Daldinia eschscholtzii]
MAYSQFKLEPYSRGSSWAPSGNSSTSSSMSSSTNSSRRIRTWKVTNYSHSRSRPFGAGLANVALDDADDGDDSALRDDVRDLFDGFEADFLSKKLASECKAFLEPVSNSRKAQCILNFWKSTQTEADLPLEWCRLCLVQCSSN